MNFVTDSERGALVRIKLKPRSSRDEIVGPTASGQLAVKVSAPPADNQANQALVELLAKKLRLPKSSLEIQSGHKSTSKTVLVKGALAADVLSGLSR